MQNYINGWYRLRDNLKSKGRYRESDITYILAGRRIKDYSLIFEHKPFHWKPPEVLQYLVKGNFAQITGLLNDIIEFERERYRTGGITDEELKHILSIKNIANFILKKKGIGLIEKQKALRGDYKQKSHWTVNNKLVLSCSVI